MKEKLLTAGLTLLSVTAGYSQNHKEAKELINLNSSFESIHGIQDCYSALSEKTKEVTPQDVKDACLMAAYSNALAEGYTNETTRQAVYELDSLVQNHKISPQYQKNLLSSNTLELAKSRYMTASSQLKNASEQDRSELEKKHNLLKSEYEAIAEIQTVAKHVQLLNPQFDENRISKYLQGAFYMKDVFENWELHSSDDKAGLYFDCLKIDIQSYPYEAAKYVDNLLDKSTPEKLAQEYYNTAQKFVNGLSDIEYDKIDEDAPELLMPGHLINKLKMIEYVKTRPLAPDYTDNSSAKSANAQQSSMVKNNSKFVKKPTKVSTNRPKKTIRHRPTMRGR